ncbi:hypothetical protein L1987_74218 [Smallanthus sonchifolius]|uniref:Uncharacterized protein n=1 Tax=Smallanthus sonchifolius TaxID=185202 RepID=A0ACB9A268_9ASTR|nr:hypothetical protein L1987_74218 [Smallanthus sonchifolius]
MASEDRFKLQYISKKKEKMERDVQSYQQKTVRNSKLSLKGRKSQRIALKTSFSKFTNDKSTPILLDGVFSDKIDNNIKDVEKPKDQPQENIMSNQEELTKQIKSHDKVERPKEQPKEKITHKQAEFAKEIRSKRKHEPLITQELEKKRVNKKLITKSSKKQHDDDDFEIQPTVPVPDEQFPNLLYTMIANNLYTQLVYAHDSKELKVKKNSYLVEYVEEEDLKILESHLINNISSNMKAEKYVKRKRRNKVDEGGKETKDDEQHDKNEKKEDDGGDELNEDEEIVNKEIESEDRLYEVSGSGNHLLIPVVSQYEVLQSSTKEDEGETEDGPSEETESDEDVQTGKSNEEKKIESEEVTRINFKTP